MAKIKRNIVGVSLNNELLKKLNQYCDKKQLTASAVIRLALIEKFKNEVA